MTGLRAAALAIVLLGACEIYRDDVDSGRCIDCDWHPFDPPMPVLYPARPVGQQGCLTGQKATWIVVQEMPDRLGKIGCVPDGVVALGDACVFGAAGETTGFDDCSGGAVCSQAACADICEFGAPPASTEGCPSGTCTADPLLFANGADAPAYGVCR